MNGPGCKALPFDRFRANGHYPMEMARPEPLRGIDKRAENIADEEMCLLNPDGIFRKGRKCKDRRMTPDALRSDGILHIVSPQESVGPPSNDFAYDTADRQ